MLPFKEEEEEEEGEEEPANGDSLVMTIPYSSTTSVDLRRGLEESEEYHKGDMFPESDWKKEFTIGAVTTSRDAEKDWERGFMKLDT